MVNMRILLGICCLLFLFSGCKNQGELINPPTSDGDVQYVAVYIIHADAGYLYHDENGKALYADEEVLEEAKQVGEAAGNGEIFIYHQKPERKILGIFPRKDRRMLHYRNGKLLNDRRYSPQKGEPILTAEAQLFHQARGKVNDSTQTIFMYFGHEIPAKGGKNYHFSQPNVQVNAHSFSKGVNSFLPTENTSFDLAVLSTCNNGNPQMLNLLQDKAKTVLASPQNLHLSHIDTEAILSLENGTESAKAVAEEMAENTFNRLKENLQTEITLFVYDMQVAGSYLPTIDSLYAEHLKGIEPKPFEENTDCAELPEFKSLDFSAGVKGWYNSTQFGRRANKSNHSGWGCRPSNSD